MDGQWSDREWEPPTGDALKKIVREHGYMDESGIAHLPDGSEEVTFDGRLPEAADEEPPAYTPAPIGSRAHVIDAVGKDAEPTHALPRHGGSNWFTHRLKPSTEDIRKTVTAVYDHAVARLNRYRMIEKFVPTHRNFLGKVIHGYWKKIRVKD